MTSETTTVGRLTMRFLRPQVMLVRAIKAGDMEGFIDEASAHPEAIHERFTKVTLTNQYRRQPLFVVDVLSDG